MAAHDLSVMVVVRAAIGFWREATPRVWAPLAVFTAVLAGMQIATALGLAPVWRLASVLVVLLTSALAYGALFRIAFEPEHPGDADFRHGPAGLQWGKPEWRILAATLLLLLFYLLVVLGAVFLAFLVAVAFGAAGDLRPARAGGFFATPAGLAAMFVLLASFVGLLWSTIRLSMALPATVDRKQVQVFSVWNITKGHVWIILGAALLTGLPSLAVGLAGGLANAMSDSSGLRLALGLLGALVGGFVQAPLTAGLYSHIYRLLRDRSGGDTAQPL